MLKYEYSGEGVWVTSLDYYDIQFRNLLRDPTEANNFLLSSCYYRPQNSVYQK